MIKICIILEQHSTLYVIYQLTCKKKFPTKRKTSHTASLKELRVRMADLRFTVLDFSLMVIDQYYFKLQKKFRSFSSCVSYLKRAMITKILKPEMCELRSMSGRLSLRFDFTHCKTP